MRSREEVEKREENSAKVKADIEVRSGYKCKKKKKKDGEIC